MQIQPTMRRTSISLTFSREFEALLLTSSGDHRSLTHDLEKAAFKGLDILEELEDVHDIKHTGALKLLVAATNDYLIIDSPYFSQWHVAVAEDLLDEIDLLTLTHGEDLAQLGLASVSQGAILVLLAVAACTDFRLG